MHCTHTNQIEKDLAPRSSVCEACAREGRRWSALRMCLTCGHVACSDDSDGHHARSHFLATGHPMVRPLGEHAPAWCYVDATHVDPELVDLAEEGAAPVGG